jgi:hypothetical protein
VLIITANIHKAAYIIKDCGVFAIKEPLPQKFCYAALSKLFPVSVNSEAKVFVFFCDSVLPVQQQLAGWQKMQSCIGLLRLLQLQHCRKNCDFVK